jgi:hypothetical protein
MVVIVTLMLGCSLLNWSTSFFMYGPSPPVKPFQNARATFGPSYVPVNVPPPPSCCWVPGGPDVPPQAAAKPARPTAADRPRKLRRERGVGVIGCSFVPGAAGEVTA